jgi:hypothetical protein
MSQGALAELFGVELPAISKRLKNIFESGELIEKGTISKMETVRQEGRMSRWRGCFHFGTYHFAQRDRG